MSTIPFTTTNNKTIPFTKSFNQHPSNFKNIQKVRSQADHMFLKHEVKAHFTIVTITVHCDTEFEHRLLTKLFRGL